jgi:hypothetical protein
MEFGIIMGQPRFSRTDSGVFVKQGRRPKAYSTRSNRRCGVVANQNENLATSWPDRGVAPAPLVELM